ncbi:unnamed protein product [Blepharisma stoltei]|uniref:EF-hand domain-containing protein n=1 Tax=Blepharisma stoltei TaxID=1481888 RepID=A0AAU9JG68_9CILI|nr:unnamed protein product [Blepharisma stoltei]
MNTDFILFELNKAKIKSLFNKHKGSDGKISLLELQKLCKILRISPDLISQPDLRTLATKSVGTASLSKASLDFNQFEEILIKIASHHFQDTAQLRERIKKFFIHISYPCKSTHNLNIISTDQTHKPRVSTLKLSTISLLNSPQQDTEGDHNTELDLNIKEALETLKQKGNTERYCSSSPRRESSPVPPAKSRNSSANPILREVNQTRLSKNATKIVEKKSKINLSRSNTMPVPENKSPPKYKIDEVNNRILAEKVELSDFLETERLVTNEIMSVAINLKDIKSSQIKNNKGHIGKGRHSSRKAKRSITICLAEENGSANERRDSLQKVDNLLSKTAKNGNELIWNDSKALTDLKEKESNKSEGKAMSVQEERETDLLLKEQTKGVEAGSKMEIKECQILKNNEKQSKSNNDKSEEKEIKIDIKTEINNNASTNSSTVKSINTEHLQKEGKFEETISLALSDIKIEKSIDTQIAKSSIEIIRSSPLPVPASMKIPLSQNPKPVRVVKKLTLNPSDFDSTSSKNDPAQPSILQIKEVFEKFKFQHQNPTPIKSSSNLSHSTIEKYQKTIFSCRSRMFSKSIVLSLLFRAWKIEAAKSKLKLKMK